MQDPYIKAMFTFLINESETQFSFILEDPEIKLSDKISFSCQYLSDEKLVSLLNRFWNDLVTVGDLNGILLCGMEEECLELLQRYCCVVKYNDKSLTLR